MKRNLKKIIESKFHWLDACPAVSSHLQEATDSHAQPDASSITQQYIQYYLIPPALCKVWQQVHEEQLLKQNGMSQQRVISIDNWQKSWEKHLANYKQLYSLYGLDFCSASCPKHA